VHHHQQQKYARQDAEQQAAYQQAYQQGEMAAAAQAPAPAVTPAPAVAPAPAIDMDQLKQLGDLHAAGVLTDEEFVAAKAKILG
jgi:hypothetical protein